MTSIITITDWEIITDIQTGGDPLRLYGRFFNHPNIIDGDFAFPSTFKSFDTVTKMGIGLSGKIYHLVDFVPNGNAKNEEIALDIILKSCEK